MLNEGNVKTPRNSANANGDYGDYGDAPPEAAAIVQDLVAKRFPDLVHAQIKVLLDYKKRTKENKITLAQIRKPNPLMRYLSQDDNNGGKGYDYIITVDHNVWSYAEEQDLRRVFSHELQHAVVKPEAKDPFKLRGHELEDFHAEVAINADDPNWRSKLAEVVSMVWDQAKDNS